MRDERQFVRDERQFMTNERQFARDERQFVRGYGVSRERRTLGPPYKRCPMGGIDGCILLGNELLVLPM